MKLIRKLSGSWASSLQRQLQVEQERHYFLEFARGAKTAFPGCYDISQDTMPFLLLPYTLLDEFKTKCRCYIILSIKTSICFFIKHLFGEKKKAADVAVLNAYLGGF